MTYVLLMVKLTKPISMKKESEKQYTEEEIDRMNETRKAADITLSRLREEGRLDELNTDNKLSAEDIDRLSNNKVYIRKRDREVNEKFIKQTRRVWKEFAVHGMTKWDKKEGQLVFEEKSDLDGEFSLEILRQAGIEPDDIEYVEQGHFKRNRINLDTGNRSGIVSNYKSRTAWLDHHGRQSKNDTSATQITYEALFGLGLLKERNFLDKNGENYLEKAVKFVTQIDNKTYPRGMNNFKKSYKTLYGLGKFLKPEDVLKFFEDGRNPVEILSDDEIEKLGLKEESERQKKNIGTSIDRLKEMERDGLIINSDTYGKIAIDIGRRIPCSDDAAVAFGCESYFSWSPPNLFFSTTKEIKPEHVDPSWEEQGIMDIRGVMLMKPGKDRTPLKIKPEDILAKLTDGKFRPNGEFKKKIEQLERAIRGDKSPVDTSGTGDTINKNNTSQNNMENQSEQTRAQNQENQEQENTFEAIKESPSQESGMRTVGELVKEYGEETKISKDSKKTFETVLAEEDREAYKDFALSWFSKHERDLRDEGRIPEGIEVTDEWKINMVLTSKDLGAVKEIMQPIEKIDDPEFKEIKERMDRIWVLQADMAKDQMPSETPFLLLHRMQESMDRKQDKIEELRGKGQEDAAVRLEKQANELRAAMTELAGKTMGEDVREKAQSEARGEINIEEKVRLGLADETNVAGREMAAKALQAEWERFNGMTDDDKKGYLKGMKFKGGIVTDPTQFKQLILSKSGFNNSEPNFYAMLDAGFKPHLKQEKRDWPWTPWRKKTVVPFGDGQREMSRDEYEREKLKAGSEYVDKATDQAKERLQQMWQGEQDKIVEGKIGERIKEVADSLDYAEGQLDQVYERAKKRVVDEFIEKQAKKNPKTKEEVAAVEKMFGEAGQEVDMGKFMGDVLFERGELANLDDTSEKKKPFEKLISFLENYGIDYKAAEEVVRLAPEADYINARKNKTNFFRFIADLVNKALNPKPIAEVIQEAVTPPAPETPTQEKNKRRTRKSRPQPAKRKAAPANKRASSAKAAPKKKGPGASKKTK